MVNGDLMRQISFYLVIIAYFVLTVSLLEHSGHALEGVIIFIVCNLMAVILFAITGFKNLTLSNYITVMGGLFGIFLGFYTLFTMEGDTIFI